MDERDALLLSAIMVLEFLSLKDYQQEVLIMLHRLLPLPLRHVCNVCSGVSGQVLTLCSCIHAPDGKHSCSMGVVPKHASMPFQVMEAMDVLPALP